MGEVEFGLREVFEAGRGRGIVVGRKVTMVRGDGNSRREREGNRGEEDTHGSFPERETMEESRMRAGRGGRGGEWQPSGEIAGDGKVR